MALKIFLLMAAVQFISYVNLVVNYRAIAMKRYHAACLSDVVASAITFFIIRKVAEQDTYAALIGMMVGGGLASYVGIWLTRHWSHDEDRNRGCGRCEVHEGGGA